MSNASTSEVRAPKRPPKARRGEFMRLDWEDDSDLEYVYGHVNLEEAKAAIEAYGGPGSGAAVKGIRHRWGRKCPAGQYSGYEWTLHVCDEPSRGTFEVTELDVATGWNL